MEIFYNATISIAVLLLTYGLLSTLFILVAYFCSCSNRKPIFTFGYGLLSEFLPNLAKEAKCRSYKNCVKCAHHRCPNSIKYKAEFDKITCQETWYDH